MKSFKKFQASALNKVQQQQLKGGSDAASDRTDTGYPGNSYPKRVSS